MTSESGINTKNMVGLLFSIFYIVAGIAEIGAYAITAAAPPHLPVLGILSLITAYTIFKPNRWTVPLVVALFFTGMTFGATTLANSLALQTFGDAMLLNIALIAYMIVLLITSLYIVMKRAKFS